MDGIVQQVTLARDSRRRSRRTGALTAFGRPRASTTTTTPKHTQEPLTRRLVSRLSLSDRRLG